MKRIKRFQTLAAQAIIALGIACAFVSCSETGTIDTFAVKQEVIPFEKTATAWKNLQSVPVSEDDRMLNAQLAELAKATAKTLKNNSAAKYLHKKVLERFDGDTEILWSTLNADRGFIQATQSHEGDSWSASVAKQSQSSTLQSPQQIAEFMTKIRGSYYANLHLYWYNPDKWDRKSSPLVTFVPTGFDVEKAKITTLTAYDAEGNTYEIDEKAAEEYPIVVLGPNERTTMNGDLLPSQSNLQRGNGSKDAQLQSVTPIYLNYVAFTSDFADNIFEAWFSGHPEFYTKIFTTTSAMQVEDQSWSFKDQIERWRCNGTPIGGWTGSFEKRVNWANPSSNQTLYFQWFEADPSTETTWGPFTLGFKIDSVTIGLSVSTKVQDRDDPMQRFRLDYNPAAPQYFFGGGTPTMYLDYSL